jgi:Protein of unknown function DUF262
VGIGGRHVTNDTELVSVDDRLEYEYETARPDDIEFERIRSEEEDYESAPPTYEINTYPADFTLEVLHQKWKAGDIEIPCFQRQFVWKQIQASKLIESFLIGLPVPAVFLYTERKTQKSPVIDGQRRRPGEQARLEREAGDYFVRCLDCGAKNVLVATLQIMGWRARVGQKVTPITGLAEITRSN